MNRSLPVTLLAAAISLGFAGCTSNAPASKGDQSAMSLSSQDQSSAIARYVAGEDNDFGDLQGDPVARSSGDYSYYETTFPIPGSSECDVYVEKKANDHFGDCDFNVTSLADAKTLYKTWVANVQSTEPSWKSIEVDPLPPDTLMAVLLSDTQEVHGCYVSLAKNDGKGYRVSTTFAKVSALKS